MGLAPEKVLLKWMNFHLKKAGFEKPVTNFTSDLKVFALFSYFSVLFVNKKDSKTQKERRTRTR